MGRAVRTTVFALLAATQVFLAYPALGRDPVAPLPELLAQARALSSSGRFADAYALLAGAEDEYIGEVQFDYALGRAALDAGYPARATLAFSRVLALDPGHAGALIDTGRAYLALGNFEQARATFESLLALDPPPGLRAQLQGFLQQARRELPGRAALSGYVAATLGRSTNVNQSPGQGQVFVPLFAARFDLAEQNVRKADRYWSIAGGLDGSLPLSETYSVVGSAELIERQNFRESAFDLGGVGARLGLAAAAGPNLVRLQWIAARNYLGHDPSRDVEALALEGFRMLGPDAQLAASAQGGRIRHVPEALRVFDANFVALGAGASRRFAGSSTLSGGILAGGEHDVGGNPDGDKRQLGFRAAADAPVRARLNASLSFALQRTGYDRVNPAFLVERHDLRRDLELSLQYLLEDAWSARIGVTWTGQRSNIPIYEFQRRELWLMVRRDFR
jgi:tetratricopeptide (TPR) repeat protein